MRINQFWTTLCTGACAAALSLSATPFSQLTEDDVDVYVSLRSWADLRTQWEAHPFAAVIEDPSLQEFLQPLLDFDQEAGADAEESFTEVLEHEFGLTWDELFELFPGQISLSWFNVSELLLKQAERPDLVVMAEYSGDFEQLEELMQVQFERNAKNQKAINPAVEHTFIEESFMGETLYFDETFDGEKTYIEDGYALVDGIFILATPEDRLRSVVEAIKDEPAASIAESEGYIRSNEEGGRGDLKFYLNLESIMPPLNAALMDQFMQGGAFMLGLNPDSLNNMFALESLQASFLDVDLIDTGLQLHSGMIYREKAGLLSLLTYQDTPLPAARFVPSGVFSTSITNFDLGEMLAQLERLLTTASPNLRAQIDSQIQLVRTNTGVDLRSAILENLGGDLVTLAVMPEGTREAGVIAEADQIFVVELENAEALSAALEALKDLVPGVREQILTQDFAGQTIHTFRTPATDAGGGSSAGMSYVITRSQFILSIGQVGLLQEVLTHLESGTDGFWQQARTEDIFEQVARPDAVARSYVDLEQWVLPIFQSIVQASQLAAGDSALDLKQIPQNLAVPFYMISETNQASDGVYNRSYILPREEAK
ncbi:DUF3352 domain-containing protein [Coraliomargarita sp. W4R53]